MVEESGPSAREIIEEKLQNSFDIERFTFADWRTLTEKTSDDTATSKFVSLTQTNRTDNIANVKGKRKDGVIINPQIDMRREDADLEAYQKSTQSSIANVKKTKDKMVNRASANIAANRVANDVKTASKYGPQRPKPGQTGAYRIEEVESIDEKAPPGKKYERMVKHIKKGYSEGGLTKKEKGIAYATAWKKYNEEVEVIDERRREDKGTPRPPEPSAAFKLVSKSMGASRAGVQPRGQKKTPGKKPPAAGEYGGPKSPAQKLAARRAAAQKAKDNMSSRFD
jgi:hypothetical protein